MWLRFACAVDRCPGRAVRTARAISHRCSANSLTRLGLLFTCNSLEPFAMLGWPLLSVRLAPAVAVDLAGKSSSNLLSPTYPRHPATASLTYHRVYYCCRTSPHSLRALPFSPAALLTGLLFPAFAFSR